MSEPARVLLVGGTGRAGRRVLEQLLDRGARACTIVRPGRKLPTKVQDNPNLQVVEAELLSSTRCTRDS